MAGKKILVTGGSGFIGSSLIDALLNIGKEVVGIDNFDKNYGRDIKLRNISLALKNKNFRLYEEDVCREKRVLEIIENEKPHVIVHLAGKTGARKSYEDPKSYLYTNVIGFRNILEACKKLSPSNIMFISSSMVYENSSNHCCSEDTPLGKIANPYAIAKRKAEVMAEEYSKKHGMNITVLRVFTVYGPRQRPDMAFYRFYDDIRCGREVTIIGGEDAKRDFIYIDDCIRGIVKSIETPLRYEIINIGSGEVTGINKVLVMMAEKMGIRVNKKIINSERAISLSCCADLGKAEKLLGYRPDVGLKEGLERFIDWAKKLME